MRRCDVYAYATADTDVWARVIAVASVLVNADDAVVVDAIASANALIRVCRRCLPLAFADAAAYAAVFVTVSALVSVPVDVYADVTVCVIDNADVTVDVNVIDTVDVPVSAYVYVNAFVNADANVFYRLPH